MSHAATVPVSTSKGRFQGGNGISFGGQFVAPGLLPILDRLDQAFRDALADPDFHRTFHQLLGDHVGRPTPLMMIGAEDGQGAPILLKREDLTNSGGSFGGAVLGQCLLARRMSLDQVVADTGSGDHGVALAATASRLGLHATIYIADPASRSQRSMVDRMRAFGATVIEVPGERTMLHHAMSGAIQHWMANGDTCLYIAGAPIGPHPYPTLVRRFQSAIGRETRAQLFDRLGVLPSAVIATMDGGSAAIGLFGAFVDDPVDLVLVEPGGRRGTPGAAPISHGRPGVLHGSYTMLLQDGDGQLRDVQSLAPGASYPAAAPELAAWASAGRMATELVDDEDAIDSLRWAAAKHGLLVSFEAAYGLAYARSIVGRLPADRPLVCAINGGGAKDLSYLEPAA